MQTKKTAIIIVHYSSLRNTQICIESISKAVAKDCIVIIVDNHSNEPFSSPKVSSVDFAKEQYIIIKNKVNLGFSGGNNVGIKIALQKGASHVLLLNNDTTIKADMLWHLENAMEQNKNIGITVPKIYFENGYEFHKKRYEPDEQGKVIWYAGGEMDWNNVIGYHRGVDKVDTGQYDKEEDTHFASGCCMLIKRNVLEKIGMFDEKYFLYYEDSDFSERVRDGGFRIYYCPKAVIWHKNAGSAGGSGSNLQDYYITRNRLLFGFKYAPLRSKLALLKESLSLFLWGREWQKKGVLDFYMQRFGQGSFIP